MKDRDASKQMLSNDRYTPESWETAQHYATAVSRISNLFTAAIRSLMGDHASQRAELSSNANYAVNRLVKSRVMQAPLYFLFKAIDRERFDDTAKPMSTKELVRRFSFFELAYLLGLINLVRRAGQHCDQEEWPFLLDPLARGATSGILFGRIIPPIGGAIGLIEGSVRFLSFSAFLSEDPKGFREYRRQIKRGDGKWSTDLEFSRWHCDSIQVSTLILQTLGFGIEIANAYLHAFSSTTEIGSPEEIQRAKTFRMAALWREVVASGQREPKVAIPGEYYPQKEKLFHTFNAFDTIQADPPLLYWLSRTKEDLEDDESGVGGEGEQYDDEEFEEEG